MNECGPVVFLVILVLCLVFISPVTLGIFGNNQAFPSGSPQDQAQTAAQKGTDASNLNVPEMTLQLSNGVSVDVEGSVDIAGGNIAKADNVKIGNAKMQGVSDFSATADNSFAVGSVDELQLNDFILTNGQNVAYNDGILTADHADSFTRQEAVAANVDVLDAGASEFSVASADTVIAGCTTVRDVSNTAFTIYQNAIEASPKDGAALHIQDCSKNQATFTSQKQAAAKAIITKTKPTTYSIENGTLAIESADHTETIEANGSATAKIESDKGVLCAILDAPSSYWYHAHFFDDFGLNVPQGTQKICFKKTEKDSYSDYNSLVDFVGNKLELNGIITYLRLPFFDNKPASFLMDQVYTSNDTNNTAEITLDPTMRNVVNITLKNSKPKAGFVAAITSGWYRIEEYGTTSSTRRLGYFNEKEQSTAVERYFANLGKAQPAVLFQNNTLIQLSKNNSVRTVMVCKSCGKKEAFMVRMTKEKERYGIGAVCAR